LPWAAQVFALVFLRSLGPGLVDQLLLPTLISQARQTQKPWLFFIPDKRFTTFHPQLEKIFGRRGLRP